MKRNVNMTVRNHKLTRKTFKTADGSLILDHKCDPTLGWDLEFIEYGLKIDAREKGVEIVEYTISNGICSAIVRWA